MVELKDATDMDRNKELQVELVNGSFDTVFVATISRFFTDEFMEL